MDQREHIAINEIQVAAVLRRNAVQVFQLPDIVGGHPAVLAGSGIAGHTAGIIATEETLQIKLHEIRQFFLIHLGPQRNILERVEIFHRHFQFF